jgi:hypothetical protein
MSGIVANSDDVETLCDLIVVEGVKKYSYVFRSVLFGE